MKRTSSGPPPSQLPTTVRPLRRRSVSAEATAARAKAIASSRVFIRTSICRIDAEAICLAGAGSNKRVLAFRQFPHWGETIGIAGFGHAEGHRSPRFAGRVGLARGPRIEAVEVDLIGGS